HFATPTPQRPARQTSRNSPGTAVSVAEGVGCFPVAWPKFVVAGVPPAISKVQPTRLPPQIRLLGYSNRLSSSVTRRSNKRNVLSIGAGVAMSTPAAFNVSSGNLEPPERKKFRYASTLPGSPDNTRSESATAAEIPVAYL